MNPIPPPRSWTKFATISTPRLTTATAIVTGKTWIDRRTLQAETDPVRIRSTATVVTSACRAAWSTKNAVMPPSGASAAPGPVAPTAEKMFEASDTSVEVEMGGIANVAPRIVNGPWKPKARRTSHSIMITTGTAATSAGVARTVASPRVIDVRILGMATALGPRGAKIESRSPLRGADRGAGARAAGARYEGAGRRCCFLRRLLTTRAPSDRLLVAFPVVGSGADGDGEVLLLEVRRAETRDQEPTREDEDRHQRDRCERPIQGQGSRHHDGRTPLVDQDTVRVRGQTDQSCGRSGSGDRDGARRDGDREEWSDTQALSPDPVSGPRIEGAQLARPARDQHRGACEDGGTVHGCVQREVPAACTGGGIDPIDLAPRVHHHDGIIGHGRCPTGGDGVEPRSPSFDAGISRDGADRSIRQGHVHRSGRHGRSAGDEPRRVRRVAPGLRTVGFSEGDDRWTLSAVRMHGGIDTLGVGGDRRVDDIAQILMPRDLPRRQIEGRDRAVIGADHRETALDGGPGRAHVGQSLLPELVPRCGVDRNQGGAGGGRHEPAA